jgi:hypothetical protein
MQTQSEMQGNEVKISDGPNEYLDLKNRFTSLISLGNPNSEKYNPKKYVEDYQQFMSWLDGLKIDFNLTCYDISNWNSSGEQNFNHNSMSMVANGIVAEGAVVDTVHKDKWVEPKSYLPKDSDHDPVVHSIPFKSKYTSPRSMLRIEGEGDTKCEVEKTIVGSDQAEKFLEETGSSVADKQSYGWDLQKVDIDSDSNLDKIFPTAYESLLEIDKASKIIKRDLPKFFNAVVKKISQVRSLKGRDIQQIAILARISIAAEIEHMQLKEKKLPKKTKPAKKLTHSSVKKSIRKRSLKK